MKCTVISIGDELLIGQTINTNASWIGEQLNNLGLSITNGVVISDDKKEIISALSDASLRSDLVLITGGLGPTKDDITKHTLCEFFNTTLELNKEVERKIVEYFKRVNRPILKSNKDQALLPKKCTILPNPRGTASGMWFERTHGMGESFLAEIIKSWEEYLDDNNIKLAYLPSPGIVKLRLTAIGVENKVLEKKIHTAIEKLKDLIPNEIYGYGNGSMESEVCKLLIAKKLTVSTAESCTVGTVSKMITNISGSSSYFNGSIISYSNQSKIELLGVDEEIINKNGAVSKQVAEQMAIGVRKKLSTDYGISTTGIAGPNGGTLEKPVGTVWIAVASSVGVVSKKLKLGYNRERNIHVSSISVLNLLRLELIKTF